MTELEPWKQGLFIETPWRSPANDLVNIKYTLLVASLIHDRPSSRMILPGITDDTNPYYEAFKLHVLVLLYILMFGLLFWALR